MTVGVSGGVSKPSIHKRIFSLQSIRKPLLRNRLGELLVSCGFITTIQLRQALSLQKVQNKPLGRIFLEAGMVSNIQLFRALVRQFALRAFTAVTLGVIAFSSFGSKKADAAPIADVPAKISVAFNSEAQHKKMVSYPRLFESSEKRSTNLKPFTKWTQMFAKFDRELSRKRSDALVQEWRNHLKRYEGLELKRMAEKVNKLVNSKRYITDSRNYGKSDYWSTPVEFLERGGDCEDFAIAKYTALRALGVPEERLRVSIVQDTLKNIPHAVLIVYTDQGPYVLDNQIKTLLSAKRAGRYRPIYSINRHAWWIHTAPGSGTRLASR